MQGISKLSLNAKQALKKSYDLSEENKLKLVDIPVLLISLLSIEEGIASRVLKSSESNKIIEKKVLDYLSSIKSDSEVLTSKNIQLSEDYLLVLENAYNIARNLYHVYVGTEHILLGIFKLNNKFIKSLNKEGISYDFLEKYISTYANYPAGLLSKIPTQEDKNNSILNVLGRNLTELARKNKLDIIIGREKEIDRIIHILERRSKNNPLLIGESGVGKTAIVNGLAQRIVRGDIPEDLRDYEIWSLDISKLIASTEMRGDLESKIMALVEEINNRKKVIIFIDEIHGIMGNNNGNGDISNILKPYLTQEVFKVIGATTYQEYQKYFESDQALNRRFQNINIEEITEATAIKILKELKKQLEIYHKIRITDDAINTAVNLSSKYIADRFLPDKAIDLLDEASAKIKLERQNMTDDIKNLNTELEVLYRNKENLINENNFKEALDVRRKEVEAKLFLEKALQALKRTRTSTKYFVTEEVVRVVISEWTGIPLSSLSLSDKTSLKSLEKNISKSIIGQEDAVSKITHTLKAARLGIRNSNRALASFLFLGPTGVGKTELSKQVALNLFGDLKSFIQIDMSEYMESHTVSKFIGSPPGYIGYQEGGQLTEKVRRRPYSVILFDEIEKAHVDVLNILLQILEEGHLTDSKGKTISFKNCIIILTSNIGANRIKDDSILGFNVKRESAIEEKSVYDGMRDKIMEELKSYLTPEFINRLDDIIIFRGLNKDDIKKITKKLLNDLKIRLKESKLSFSFNDNVIDFIADKGFNKEYGARPINRSIEEHVEFPLSDKLLLKNLGNVNYSVYANVVENKGNKFIEVSIE